MISDNQNNQEEREKFFSLHSVHGTKKTNTSALKG